MEIQVLFFAHFKEKAGTPKVTLNLPDGSTVGALKATLAGQFPGTAQLMGNSVVSVNQHFAFDGDRIPDGAEVAVFPPVSGGSGLPTILHITNDVLDLNDLVQQVTLPTTGAVAVFTGVVRGSTLRGQAHETARLEYEAYKPMAEAKMAQVAEEIRERWPAVEGIAIVQRVGLLDPGTPTVLIACSAAHRDTGCFEAARYGIDRLKEIVPVWKKEIGPDGEDWVAGKYQPQKGD
ncbi:molybdopterin synthase subunit MoaE [Longilinea arvoryzae]|uniref:Molybdopterin synthase subunit MoaE n=1 Tax=Longilinea arvoryzae TaxID=360412 RepID=A0A0S7BMS2_9CHLR|nr:molybdenum cofactor biosynthesis protein MoaE [Longilinea arvoryzae]GAP15034.1 molybdopterin synthase subunit MoaE [Longilinea arvoryzae]